MVNLKKVTFRSLLEQAVTFVNSRNVKERRMILILLALTVLVADYWLIMRPVVGSIIHLTPTIHELKKEKNALLEDKRNQKVIEKDWSDIKVKLTELEKSFISTDETSALLENLSGLASASSVRMMSITPGETKKSANTGIYTHTPISIVASAAFHNLGRFLEKMETGVTFYKVKNLRIIADEAGGAAHSIFMNVEAYRREL